MKKYYVSAAIVSVTILFIYLFIPQFLNPINVLINILVPVCILLFFSLGMMLIMSGGGVDLSMGSTAGLCGLIGVALSSIMPSPLAIIFALIAGAVVGSFNGALIAGLGISPFVITLGSTFIIKGLQYIVAAISSSSGIQGTYLMVPNNMMFLSNEILIVIVSIIVSLLLFFLFELSVAGRKIQFIGINPNTSRLSGIRTRLYTVLTYIIAGVLCAIAGLFLSSLQGIVRVGLGEDQLLDSFIVPLLGAAIFNRFSIKGVVISSFIIVVFVNLTTLLGLSITIVQFAKGTMLIAVLIAVGIKKWISERRLVNG